MSSEDTRMIELDDNVDFYDQIMAYDPDESFLA